MWAIELAHGVRPEVSRRRGWGILPAEDSYRQRLTQDFDIGGFYVKDYGEKMDCV